MVDNLYKAAKAIWADCQLGRMVEAVNLQRYIRKIHCTPRDRGHTINIDAKWGEGKTYFLERWKKQLKTEHLVIYWNAWESDFSDDPLLSLYAALSDLEVDGKPAQSKILDQIKGLLPQAIHVGAKYVAQSSIKELNGHIDYLAIEEQFNHERVIIRKIKDLLKNLAKLAEESETERTPIYVLVDELDRCKPVYALELLERVKHIFDVPGFQFVFATDTEQLAHTVKAVYGADFDARRYLKRFFDLQYRFPEVSKMPHAKFLFDEKRTDINQYMYLFKLELKVEKIFCDFAEVFQWSMRDRAQIFEKLEHVARYFFSEKTLHVVPMLYFLGLQHMLTKTTYDKATEYRTIAHLNKSYLARVGQEELNSTAHHYQVIKYTNTSGHSPGSESANINIHKIIDFYLSLLGKKESSFQSVKNTVEYDFQDRILSDFLSGQFHGAPGLETYPDLAINMGGFLFQG